MITREAIFEHVRTTMHEMFEIDPARVRLETHLIDDLGLDSIDAIDLAARIEEFSRARLGEEQLHKLRTVEDVVNLIHATQPPEET